MLLNKNQTPPKTINKIETLNKKDVNTIALQKIINTCNARALPPTQTMQQVTHT